jgi:hypothetical protein
MNLCEKKDLLRGFELLVALDDELLRRRTVHKQIIFQQGTTPDPRHPAGHAFFSLSLSLLSPLLSPPAVVVISLPAPRQERSATKERE